MKKSLIALLAIILIAGFIAWQKRDAMMLAVIKIRSAAEYDIAPNKEISWQSGPARAVQPGGERPPNIILIVADDLGYNDISTFGGGVADGQLETPNIDRLAAEGANFSQSYSGASTCAPSRAVMMTGRYPTRTGFEFTPAPSGMGKMVSSISASMDSGMPPDRPHGAHGRKTPYEVLREKLS